MGRMVDANQVATDYGYDASGTLATSTQQLPGGPRQTTYYYNNNFQIKDVVYATGRVDRFRYNAAGRLEFTGNALNQFVRVAIDTPSNTVRRSSERHVPTLSGSTPVAVAGGEFSSTMIRDTLGRSYAALGNAGQRVDYRYDNNSNLRTRTDAANRTTTYEYDALNRVKTMTAADNGVTRFDYDAEGNLKYVRDPRGLQTNYTYNGFGQLLTLQSPDTGTTNYTYDPAGRMASESRADGRYITYGWDSLDRPTSRTAGGVTESFTYDEGTYGKGRLTRFNDATGQTSYGYNAAGELVGQSNLILGETFNTAWSYDTAGRQVGMTYPSGLVLTYNYDGYGRVSGVTSNLAWSTIADSMLYQPATGERYAWRFGSGVARLMYTDLDKRLSQLYTDGLQNHGFGFNTTDTIASLTNYTNGAMNTSYAYDAVDRLTTASRSGDPQSFSSDAVGNRTAHARAGQTFNSTMDSIPRPTAYSRSVAARRAPWATTRPEIFRASLGRMGPRHLATTHLVGSEPTTLMARYAVTTAIMR